LDILLAGAGMLVLLPVLAVVALLVKLSSAGPVFYRTVYVGYRGRTFVGYKFRSMVDNAEDLKSKIEHLNHMVGPAFKIRNDPRVTPLGRVLRKYSIDELPQLWNVVRGDMSLVGPRPPLPEEYKEFEPWQRAKLAVCPGITCYWQIEGRSEIWDFAEWAKLDLRYIEEWSLWTDLVILLRTIPAVIKGDGAY
jgi:lipopolysaccharide/colanic/teichoic acid biosynthesis glycosyltransferase